MSALHHVDYEAFLSCDQSYPCGAAGYILISLGTSDPTKAVYYLIVGGAAANSSATILAPDGTPAIDITTDNVRLHYVSIM